MNHFILLLAITLSVLSISTVSVYGALLDSPLYQIQNGVDLNDIQCNDSLVLVLRTSGHIACVKESSADKLGWEIIESEQTGFPHPEDPDYESSPNQPEGGPITEEELRQQLKEKGFSEEDIEEAIQEVFYFEVTTTTINENENTKKEYFEIWNPIPEDQRDDIAELFANALDDIIIGKGEQYEYHYDTEKGSISIADRVSVGGMLSMNVHYGSHLSIYDSDERRKFVYDFMENASLDHTDIKLVEQDHRRYVVYYFLTDKNFIEFKFGNDPWKSTTINLLSWSNNPTPPSYEISEKEAKDIAFEYGQQNEFFREKESGEDCEVTLHDEQSDPLKYALWGEPHYNLIIGFCEYPSRHGLEAYSLSVFVNGITGEITDYMFNPSEEGI